MSQQNLDVVRRLHELGTGEVLSGRDLSDIFDPDVDWFPVAQSLLAATSYHGHEGVRRFFKDLLSTWDEYLVEPEEFLDFGDQVVVTICIRARSGRGIEVAETWSGLYTLRGGRIIRFQGFTDRHGALDAATRRG